MGFSFKKKGFSRKSLCSCMDVLLLCLLKFIHNYIEFFPTSGIRAQVRLGAMAGEEGKTSGIEKFDGTNFGYWKMQIEDYLYGKKLHLPLLGKKPKSMDEEEWSVLDRQVLGVIQLTLTRSNAHDIVKEKTTTDLMKVLSSMYEKLSANNKVHLMKKLFNLKMVEGIPVAQHLSEFNTITNQFSSVEINFDDEIHEIGRAHV